ncbi:hypothetical protein E4U40_004216 [Claviceps sp. LM458 group G5]|nr:hypothetical protein E4U40_004216 [Claviceps sp. LM458 group G5]
MQWRLSRSPSGISRPADYQVSATFRDSEKRGVNVKQETQTGHSSTKPDAVAEDATLNLSLLAPAP